VFSLKKLLYNEIYINIVQGSEKTDIYVEELVSKGSVIAHEESFNSSEKVKIYEYIISFVNRSPINYITILDPSLSQGAFPTCSSADMAQFCDLGANEHICVGKNWGYYTSKLDLLQLQGRYKKIGLDFVFSPFYMLQNFFKDKIEGELALYILVTEDYMALCVFENSNLKFASLQDMQKETDENDDLIMDVGDDDELLLADLEDESSVDLDDIDIEDDDDDIDGLDDIDDLDDFDSFDDMDDFTMDGSDDDTFSSTEKPLDDVIGQSTFGEDYHRFSLIQSAVNTFYKDSKYDGQFIQSVFVADGIGLNNEFKRFLEEEMFLNVFIRRLDIGQELCELAKVEKK
jgi:hypothetical protein